MRESRASMLITPLLPAAGIEQTFPNLIASMCGASCRDTTTLSWARDDSRVFHGRRKTLSCVLSYFQKNKHIRCGTQCTVWGVPNHCKQGTKKAHGSLTLDLLVSLRRMLKQAERSGRFDKKIRRRWENIPTRAKRSEEISHHRGLTCVLVAASHDAEISLKASLSLRI